MAAFALIAALLGTIGVVAEPAPVAASGALGPGETISAGGEHTCGVTTAGGAMCWGDNQWGALGTGTTTWAQSPVAVSGLSSGVRSVAAGAFHSCAVTTAGGVKCWGTNSQGQLGNGTTTTSLVPVDVVGLSSGVATVVAGTAHSCALLTTGGVTCWGQNANRQLGDGTTTSSSVPVDVSGLTSGVTSIAAGQQHTCVVTSAGGAKCWGQNTNGKLGDGTTTNSATPVDVSGLTSGVASVATGNEHSCAVTTGGAAKCWGLSTNGELGYNSTTSSSTPKDVTGLASGVASIDAGWRLSCALLTSGGVKCWGAGDNGQLGAQRTTRSLVPVDVEGVTSGVTALTTGGGYSCALSATGQARCWGVVTSGALGNGTGSTASTAAPVGVSGLGSGVTAGTAGDTHSCAVNAAGGAVCWGSGGSGKLGNGATANVRQPVDVSGLTTGVSRISGGASHTCAITTAGGARCWGSNAFYMLGNGTFTSSSVPVNVTGMSSGAASTAVANVHSCALSTTGGLKCWGSSDQGLLGSSSANQGTPLQVDGLTSGVKSIATGYRHSCAVTAAGGVKCWGNNEFGKLGDGTTTTRTAPTDVSGLTSGVASVAVGSSHSCALLTAGGVKCWGSAWYGAIGDGTAENGSMTPVDVIGLSSGVTAISAGLNNTCALLATGGVKCWGNNANGTVGMGATSNPVTVPTDVVGLSSGVTQVWVGGQHACALKTGGAVVCWGSNATGQLGILGPPPVIGGFEFAQPAAVTPAAPTISGSRSPAANAAGWNNEPVTVSFSCSSPALASCTSPVTVSTDGADQSVTGTVTDTASQTASATVSGISIDRVAPLLSGVATSSPNAAGWYSSPVTMGWTCDDALSGIAAGACPAASPTVGEGPAVSVSASVVDRAGNPATASSESVKVDLTKPSTGVSSPPTWSNTDVTLTLSPTDALSGVASTSYRIDGGAVQSGTAPVVSGQGTHTVSFWSTDVAGNEETAQSVQVRIDVQAPSITADRSVAPNAAGWNNGPVTVTFDCGDEAGGSGVASCSAPQAFTAEADTTATGNATDNAGNSASVQVPVRIDQTAPTVTADVPAANANGWFNAPVQVPFTCSDTGGSGVASCPAPVVFGGDGADQAVTGQAVDAAGNTGSASGATVSLDTTAPTISGAAVEPANPGGGYDGNVTVRWTCADALSGVVTCPADVAVSGEGVHVVSRSVTDRAGNTSTAEVTVQINHDPSTDPGTVHGTITDSSSSDPVAGATVTLRTTSNAIVATTTTATNGTYAFPAVADGTYKLYAAKSGAYLGAYRAGTFTVAHGTSTTADQALAPMLVLSGTVRSSGGAPIAGATVRVSPASAVAVTDATGAYRVTGLNPGAVTVKVLATGFVATGEVPMTLSANRTHDVNLTSAAVGGGVKGTVTAQAGGSPLAGATVRIYLKGASTFSQTISTGADGRYRVPTLAEGTYEIDVVRADYQVRWFGDSLSRSGAAPVAITTGCTASPGPAWGDPCAFPAPIAMRR